MVDVEFKREFAQEYSKDFEKEIRKLLKEEPIIKQACREKFGDQLNTPSAITESNTSIPITPVDPEEQEPGIVPFIEKEKESILILEGNEQKVKHLYRKIVQKTHPDKVKSDALNELYRKSTEASKKRDILTLYAICDELGIKFKITDKEIETIKQRVMIIKHQNMMFERSHLWMWVHTRGESKKKEVIKHFLLQNAPIVKGLFS
jgi:hypothetical protein